MLSRTRVCAVCSQSSACRVYSNAHGKVMLCLIKLYTASTRMCAVCSQASSCQVYPNAHGKVVLCLIRLYTAVTVRLKRKNHCVAAMLHINSVHSKKLASA